MRTGSRLGVFAFVMGAACSSFSAGTVPERGADAGVEPPAPDAGDGGLLQDKPDTGPPSTPGFCARQPGAFFCEDFESPDYAAGWEGKPTNGIMTRDAAGMAAHVQLPTLVTNVHDDLDRYFADAPGRHSVRFALRIDEIQASQLIEIVSFKAVGYDVHILVDENKVKVAEFQSGLPGYRAMKDVGPITLGQWHHVELVVELGATNRYEASLDNTSISGSFAARTNDTFTGKVRLVAGLVWIVSWKGPISYWLDDILLSTAPAP